MKKKFIISVLLLLAVAFTDEARAETGNLPARVLVVIAHPDDESTIAVTLYKIAKEQHGIVDLFVITNGEGGYKYATLAENYYGLALTDEKTGRENLPRIRKKELMNAGNILGVNEYYFLDQTDDHYTENEKEALDTSWDVPVVKERLNQVLKHNNYDFVFCLLPENPTHGAHKAATLLALETVAALPAAKRPVILGATLHSKADAPVSFHRYSNYPVTQTVNDSCVFCLDRTARFSYRDKMNYKVIANWEIAEHKSQGVTQMTMNEGDLEQYWYFSVNGNTGLAKARALFDELSKVPYVSRVY
ncbi:PIG-L family deacetylase [Mucilaginibacter sp. SMC90]|uniref:PIG-L family deacetylase n=1 Tax=Mucilaginibacter sp. SMC90 TaxID=2929803 RepID=UPI001FB547FE|nr:PIG-L family deacetylase [Mucilaginibacter sp. SMC90]UOE50610.1 PIG-L family deacetylase [Mucilaginibacter sp. SMC90]